MKKLLTLVLALCILCSGSALALNYRQHFTNEATFETFEEAYINGPIYMAEATGRAYVGDPAMATYPAGTTYIYRSANMYTSLSAAARMNANIIVFTGEKFADKDAALAYIKGMGLTDIIDEAIGSVILVTPIDATAGFGTADQYAFYQMQSAMCNIGGAGVNAEGARVYYADNGYYGGLTYRYVIGVDEGASFINNYIAGHVDYISRVAGLLLVGGSIDRIREVAAPVPTYLVNPVDRAVTKYAAANETDTCGYEGDVAYYFNQNLPLQRVYVEYAEDVDLAATVKKVYNGMFVKALRNAVVQAGLHNASTLYTSYNWNQAPYSLGDRYAFYTGKTAGGIYVTEHQEKRFATEALTLPNGEYLETWYELLPEEVVNHTAKEGSIPLILANHGGGDDPMQYLDEIGLIGVAENERVAIVAPYHSGMTSVLYDVLPELVKYMLDTYPELDRSRVYVTGYSMGGRASLATLSGDASLFAAAVPQGSVTYLATEEQAAQYKDIDIPIMFMTSTYDFHMDEPSQTLRLAYWFGVKSIYFDYTTLLNLYLGYNEMDTVDFDFETYPMSGFKADSYKRQVLNGEYASHTWMMNNAEGVPMVGLNVTEYLPHGLYQEYGKLAWDFLKHYTRDPETKVISYNPYVK